MFTVRVLGLHRILNASYTMRAGPQPVDAPPAQIPACRSHTQRNASFKVRGLPWSVAKSFKQCVCHLSPFFSTAGLKYPPHSTLVNSTRPNSSHSKCLLALTSHRNSDGYSPSHPMSGAVHACRAPAGRRQCYARPASRFQLRLCLAKCSRGTDCPRVHSNPVRRYLPASPGR